MGGQNFWPSVVNCIGPACFVVFSAITAWLGGANILSNSIFGIPTVGLAVALVSVALFAIFRSHFNNSVHDWLVWSAIVVRGIALICFFALLYQAEGILCTAPICPNTQEVALDDPRFVVPLGQAHESGWLPVPPDVPTVQVDTRFGSALYYSTVTFTTLGYGDFQPPPRLRLIAGLEAVMGYAYLGMVVGLLIDLGKK